MRSYRHWMVVGSALLALAGACEDDDGNGRSNDNAQTGDGGLDGADTRGQAMNDAGPRTGGDARVDDVDPEAGQQGGDAGGELTDPQIAAVSSTVNLGEIMMANAALPKLTNADVSAFAQDMITSHTAAQDRQTALLMQKGITPAENELSQMLKTQGEQIVAQLNASTPPQTDRLYIESQEMVHQLVLNQLDLKLIPEADDEDLKNDLRTAREEVNAHLEHVRTIRATLP